MSTLHTPGPWMVFSDHPSVPDDIAFIRPSDQDSYGSPGEIASVYCCGPDTPGALNARANASLIAAAPDLLEALQAVADFVAGVPDAPEPFAMVRAAIAKATGAGA